MQAKTLSVLTVGALALALFGILVRDTNAQSKKEAPRNPSAETNAKESASSMGWEMAFADRNRLDFWLVAQQYSVEGYEPFGAVSEKYIMFRKRVSISEQKKQLEEWSHTLHQLVGTWTVDCMSTNGNSTLHSNFKIDGHLRINADGNAVDILDKGRIAVYGNHLFLYTAEDNIEFVATLPKGADKIDDFDAQDDSGYRRECHWKRSSENK